MTSLIQPNVFDDKRSDITDYASLVEEDRVHVAVYTRPEIFDAEMERIFHKTWVFVGHDSEVPEPGDFRLRTIGKVPVIMVRDRKGEVHVMVNRCRHRGNAVCQVDQGNTNEFYCAYHGWTYDLDGRLASVTYPKAYGENFDPRALALARVARVDAYQGFVFASLVEDVPDLKDHLAGAKAQLDLAASLSPTGKLSMRCGVQKFMYRGNWKFQIENGVDGYHPNFLHQSFFAMQRKYTGTNITPMFTDDSSFTVRDLGNGHAMIDQRALRSLNSEREKKLAGKEIESQEALSADMSSETSAPWERSYREAMVMGYGKDRAEEIIASGGTHLEVFPNLTVVESNVRVVIPIAVDKTYVFMYPVLLEGAPAEKNALRLRRMAQGGGAAGLVSTDDNEIFERNQVGLTGEAGGVPWLLLSRGLGRETSMNGERIGGMTDETSQRGIWRQWKKLMSRTG